MTRRTRTLLATILVLLTLLMCGLTYLYVRISAPQRSVAPVELEGMEFERALFGTSEETTGFVRPARVAVAADNSLVVSDTDPDTRYVVRVSPDGRIIDVFKPLAPWMMPAGVAIWPDGETWVADYAGAHIVAFGADGDEVNRFALPTVSSINIVEDRAYVCTLGDVRVMDQGGNVLATYGTGRGSGPTQFDIPHGAVPAGDDVIVADSLNAKVVRMSPDGAVVWSTGGRPKGMNEPATGAFNLPSDLTIGQDGVIVVVDGFNNQVTMLDPESGKVLKQVGEIGSADGQFYYPDGLAYLGDDRYVVADKFNSRLQVVRIPLPGATETGPLGRVTAGLGGIARVLMGCAVLLLLLLIALALLLIRRRRGLAGYEAETLPEAGYDES